MPKRWIRDEKAVEEFLAKAIVGRLGCAVNGQPYVVPVCFAYQDGKFYFHSALIGRKLAAIRANPRVCFEVDAVDKVHRADTACEHSVRYTSVIAVGKARVIEEPEVKRRALEWLVQKYAGDVVTSELDEGLGTVEVVEIVVNELTMKRNVEAG